SMTPSLPLPPASTPSSSSPPSQVFPALHLTPLNDTFVPKQISLAPAGTKIKIGRQTNAKTIPNGSNGYFDSKVLSRAHAEVWSEEGKVRRKFLRKTQNENRPANVPYTGQIFIKDVKSSNGTFINGQRLSLEAAESDIFELHTEDVVEFGIDIVSDDSKTIVHHKVAAKVYLVMNQDDAAASSREFNNWYRHAGEQPVQRRGVKAPSTNSNGLSFEHVLSRLQGELQKSRDTSTNLGDLTSTLNDVHDTLGGGPPPPLPPFSNPRPPYTSQNGHHSSQSNGSAQSAPQKDLHAQSIAALQSQLNETQSSLAGHVGKIRDLEGLLAEHEVIKREVGTLRKQMEDAQRGMEFMMRARSGPTESINGRESPVAALLDAQEELDDEDDEADARSVSSVETVRLSTAEQRASMAHVKGGPNGVEQSPSPTGTSEPAPVVNAEEDLAHSKKLQEQNAKLVTRLEALSVELDEATALGQTLRSQHAEASSTIRTLEARVQGLEKAVEGRQAEVEVKALAAVEEKWNGWKNAFEESWKKEREGWEEEREKLRSAVKEWEERKRLEALEESDWERSEDGDVEEEAEGGQKDAGEVMTKGVKSKRPRSRRRRRSTATRVSTLAADPTPAPASDSDSTIGDSKSGASGGNWNGPQRGGPLGARPFDNAGGPRGPGTDRASQAGWLWSRLALAPNSFEVEFEFRVDGKSSTLYGDGMAVWLTKSRAGMGPVFGSTDYWDGLGIFFDTYANSRHSYAFPRIYGIVNDGKKSYEIGKDGQGQEAGSCSLDFRRTDVTAKARITYFKGQFTEVAIHHDKWDEWTTCFTIPGLELPSNPFLGFTAHTGDVHVSLHQVRTDFLLDCAFATEPNHVFGSQMLSNKPPRRSIPGFAFFSYLASLLKWVFLIVIVIVGVMGFRGWKAKQSLKRF
ncbi:hypothetical protein P7C70_g8387, partial [Phenoliferia sp. Uapishka_3]